MGVGPRQREYSTGLALSTRVHPPEILKVTGCLTSIAKVTLMAHLVNEIGTQWWPLLVETPGGTPKFQGDNMLSGLILCDQGTPRQPP